MVHAACRSPTPQQLQWSVRMTSLPCPQIGPSSSPAREQYLHALPRSDSALRNSMSRIRQPVPTNRHASCTVLASDGLVTPLARRGCNCNASTIRQPHRLGLVPPRPPIGTNMVRLVCTARDESKPHSPHQESRLERGSGCYVGALATHRPDPSSFSITPTSPGVRGPAQQHNTIAVMRLLQ